MRKEEVYFEAFARSQGYNTDKALDGSYVNQDTILVRRGFAPGFSAGLDAALHCVRALVEETES